MKKGEKWQKKTTPKKRTKQRVLTEEIDGAIFLKAETANQAETHTTWQVCRETHSSLDTGRRREILVGKKLCGKCGKAECEVEESIGGGSDMMGKFQRTKHGQSAEKHSEETGDIAEEKGKYC